MMQFNHVKKVIYFTERVLGERESSIQQFVNVEDQMLNIGCGWLGPMKRDFC
jgi:hypothetical protein